MPLGIGKTTKTKDVENLPSELKDVISSTPNQAAGIEGDGLNCDNINEPVPIFNRAPCEEVLEGKNNNYIVLGRDRPASRASGYGGRGATQAGMIDIVVGRMSAVGPRSDIYADPNVTSDAARIYISQRTDIDANFGLVKGGVGLSRSRSGIGIKADAVRIMAREGIKLITGMDSKNSHGGKRQSTLGIDLIAGNDDEPESHFSTDRGFFEIERLQPIPKGYNLAECLKQIIKQVDNLNGIVDNFITSQMTLNSAILAHTHVIVPITGPALPSPDMIVPGILTAVRQLTTVKSALWLNKTNLMLTELNYCVPFGLHWINSRFNKTN